MLDIKNLTVKFDSLVAVNNLNFEVKKNTIHSLIGPNGAGKTTVFNAVYNFVPYTGDIIFKEKKLKNIPIYARSSLGISRTFQNLNLFYSMTVEENIAMGLHTKTKSNILNDILGINVYSRKEVKEKIGNVAELVGLKNFLNLYPVFLPYGTQKLVELARAVVSDPELILLDEVAAGLNDSEKQYFKTVLLKIKDSGKTILLVEHDMGVVMDISDFITVMNFGFKIAEGKPDEISGNKEVIEAYLGVS